MKKLIHIASLIAALAVPAAASADIIGGVQLQAIPSGEVEVDFEGSFGNGNLEASLGEGDLEPTFGLALTADYIVHPNVTVGLAPRFAFGLKVDDDQDGSTQIDIPLRLTGRFVVASKVALFGYGQVGYSFILPAEDREDVDDPKGLVLGFGGGAGYALSRKLAIVGELGYTIGYQGVSYEGEFLGVPYDGTITIAPRFLHIGIGVQTAF